MSNSLALKTVNPVCQNQQDPKLGIPIVFLRNMRCNFFAIWMIHTTHRYVKQFGGRSSSRWYRCLVKWPPEIVARPMTRFHYNHTMLIMHQQCFDVLQFQIEIFKTKISVQISGAVENRSVRSVHQTRKISSDCLLTGLVKHQNHAEYRFSD